MDPLYAIVGMVLLSWITVLLIDRDILERRLRVERQARVDAENQLMNAEKLIRQTKAKPRKRVND